VRGVGGKYAGVCCGRLKVAYTQCSCVWPSRLLVKMARVSCGVIFVAISMV